MVVQINSSPYLVFFLLLALLDRIHGERLWSPDLLVWNFSNQPPAFCANWNSPSSHHFIKKRDGTVKYRPVPVYFWITVLYFKSYCQKVTYCKIGNIKRVQKNVLMFPLGPLVSRRICPKISQFFFLLFHRPWALTRPTQSFQMVCPKKNNLNCGLALTLWQMRGRSRCDFHIILHITLIT